MAPTKKRNKAYRPHPVSPIGGISAISVNRNRVSTLPAERQANVVIAYHTSIDAMTGGYAQPNHYDTIVYALDIGVILAENGIGGEHLDLLRPAVDAMHRCRSRYEESGKFGLDGDGLQAIQSVAGLHEAQMAVATHGELKAAIDAMYRRVAQQKRMA